MLHFVPTTSSWFIGHPNDVQHINVVTWALSAVFVLSVHWLCVG